MLLLCPKRSLPAFWCYDFLVCIFFSASATFIPLLHWTYPRISISNAFSPPFFSLHPIGCKFQYIMSFSARPSPMTLTFPYFPLALVRADLHSSSETSLCRLLFCPICNQIHWTLCTKRNVDNRDINFHYCYCTITMTCSLPENSIIWTALQTLTLPPIKWDPTEDLHNFL